MPKLWSHTRPAQQAARYKFDRGARAVSKSFCERRPRIFPQSSRINASRPPLPPTHMFPATIPRMTIALIAAMIRFWAHTSSCIIDIRIADMPMQHPILTTVLRIRCSQTVGKIRKKMNLFSFSVAVYYWVPVG